MARAEIAQLRLKHLRFPGRAGEHQVAGETASLIRELGDNYGFYHAFLARRLRDIGGKPDPADFEDDFTGYCLANDEAVEVVIAEAMTRRSRGLRKFGRGLERPTTADPPLIDERGRLVSAETKRATPDAGPGKEPPADSTQPPPPGTEREEPDEGPLPDVGLPTRNERE